MATAMTDSCMSLDGFSPYPSDEVRPLFDRYGNGDVALRAPDVMTFRVSEASAGARAACMSTPAGRATGP
jgi:hypothetical protein